MRIAVYCSARQNIAVEYQEAASAVGHSIGAGGHTLIYGGLSLGLMDIVSRPTKKAGGRIVGIVPVSRTGLTSDINDETIQVADLNERKARMIPLRRLHRTSGRLRNPRRADVHSRIFKIHIKRY